MVLEELILTVPTLGACGGLGRTDFQQFLLWEGVVVMKELIFNSFCTRGGVTNEDDVQLPWITEAAGITNSIEDQM